MSTRQDHSKYNPSRSPKHPNPWEMPINRGVHHSLRHPTGVPLTPRCFSFADDQAENDGRSENDGARLTMSSDPIGCSVKNFWHQQ
ncbi:hypothetical protein TIFTF001_032499 [Ficus carica]|uniref:Uncharacterized protein n=1 Tax=Ficus carica TaxID=3494 RepID=A0AA88J5V4_FICCA|nr:hypothetical protein TIFTF001_032499 [Ficus carica]